MKNKFLGLLGGLGGLSLLTLSATASAEPSTALDRLVPAPAGDGFLAVPSAPVGDTLRTSFGILGSFAKSPLSLRLKSGDQVLGSQTLVSHQMIVHALASIEFLRRFKLEVDAPLIVSQAGQASTDKSVPLDTPGGVAGGDLRLGARAEIAEQKGARPSVAAAFSVWLPSSNPGPYNGASDVRLAPWLIVGADAPRYAWSVAIARRLQDAAAGSFQRSEVLVAAAAAARLGPLQVGPEFWLHQAVEDSAHTSRQTGAEALLTARYRAGSWVMSLGGGPGLGAAPGTPAYRVVAGLMFSPEVLFLPTPPRRRDQPPAAAGPAEVEWHPIPAEGTPPPGPSATPPSVAPGPGPAPRPDRDGDGVADDQDKCPAEAGVASLDPAKNGCPADQDGDGVPDARDACPGEKGEPSAEPKENGCPRSVRVQGEQIVILQQVNFKTGSDVIDPSSFGLLQQVTDVIKQKPDVARVAIDGHTDNQGLERSNVELSRRRAVAVMRWMVDHGIDARRLEARGFGPKRPIADNKTEAGRAKNRRVEFQILRRTARGEAGWQEGSEP